MTTARQQSWLDAAATSADPARSIFLALALPNDGERVHNCREHAVGFRRDGRRGFKCGICRTVVKWVDQEAS